MKFGRQCKSNNAVLLLDQQGKNAKVIKLKISTETIQCYIHHKKCFNHVSFCFNAFNRATASFHWFLSLLE